MSQTIPPGPPPFEPHPFLPNGHLQTIAGHWLRGRSVSSGAADDRDFVSLADGDRLVVRHASPPQWQSGQPAAVLVHGLSGSANASYVLRLARRLHERGIRAVRVNLRGAGEGLGHARRFYHAGRSDDIRSVVEWLATRHAPGSPIALVGFSLGGNLVLKLAAEATDRPVAGLDCVLAACAPVDLAACTQYLGRQPGRIYDRSLVRSLRAQVAALQARRPDTPPAKLQGVHSLVDFDARYTAPANGFASAQQYYESSSSGRRLDAVRLDGLLVHSLDDPFIPPNVFHGLSVPSNLQLEVWLRGGHLGFISRRPWGRDRRWLDARIEAWLTHRWSHLLADDAPKSSGDRMP